MAVSKWKLLRGKHAFSRSTDPNNPESQELVVYVPGDTFESEQDLSKHNSPGSLKFERLLDTARVKYKLPPGIIADSNAAKVQAAATSGFKDGNNPLNLEPLALPKLGVPFPQEQIPSEESEADTEDDAEGDESDPTKDTTELENMTVDQLKKLAEECEVDLGSAKLKAEIIKTLVAAGI
jgi:hypothetical protein